MAKCSSWVPSTATDTRHSRRPTHLVARLPPIRERDSWCLDCFVMWVSRKMKSWAESPKPHMNCWVDVMIKRDLLFFFFLSPFLIYSGSSVRPCLVWDLDLIFYCNTVLWVYTFLLSSLAPIDGIFFSCFQDVLWSKILLLAPVLATSPQSARKVMRMVSGSALPVSLICACTTFFFFFLPLSLSLPFLLVLLMHIAF